jgi:hypothetical protein
MSIVRPARLLEMLSDRFGAFEAIANRSFKLARVAPEEVVAMDVVEFGDGLRNARTAARNWIAFSQAVRAPLSASPRTACCSVRRQRGRPGWWPRTARQMGTAAPSGRSQAGGSGAPKGWI